MYKELNTGAQPRNPDVSSGTIHRCGQVPHRTPDGDVEEQIATSNGIYDSWLDKGI